MRLPVIAVQLSTPQIKELCKEVKGRGGFQNLLRDLQENMFMVRKATWVIITPAMRERIKRYATRYGSGGWQARLLNGLGSAWAK